MLLERLRAGDEQAFVALLERLNGPLLRLARSFVAPAVAEEVVQETWVAVVDGLAKFEARASLKTWIFRILVNRARTRGARESRSVPFSSMEGDASAEAHAPAVDAERFRPNGRWAQPPKDWRHSEKLLMDRETMQVLRTALDALPPNQRAVVMLRDVEGLDSQETCNVLEIGETNQRVLLHRGRAKLRRVLEDHLA